MKIKADVIDGTCTALAAVLETVSSGSVGREVVADGFHALFGWDPEALADEDGFEPAAAADVMRDVDHARRILHALNRYLLGKVS